MQKLTAYISVMLIGVAIFVFSEVALGGIVQVRTGVHGTVLQKSVKSLKELRYEGVVRQQLDFSCGSAALATIFRYFYGKEITEEEVVEDLLKHSDREKVMTKGFSLLDLKRYAERTGYKAEGYKVRVEHLSKIKIPTIVLLDVRDYLHFVVLKGVRGAKVFLGDPALGNRVISLKEFSRGWNGIVFAVFGKKTDVVGYEDLKAIGVPKDEIWRIKDFGLSVPFMTLPFEIKK